ncbi:MAG: hypothetical protein ACLTS6_13060 [Anaerobutyricum sp.]
MVLFVYNEMKGVFSSPDDVLARKRSVEALLKDTPYAFESGGDPDAIPELTREKFLEFRSAAIIIHQTVMASFVW